MMDGALFCCVVSGLSLILFCGLAYAVAGWFLETQQGLCACGLANAAIGALPTFAYEAPREAEGGGDGDGDGDEDSGEPHVSSALCPVCLEVVQAGEMVRQLPACRHLFHLPRGLHRREAARAPDVPALPLQAPAAEGHREGTGRCAAACVNSGIK